jgi:hypothetical protein
MYVDWSKAPKWAMWHVVDRDGEGYWYCEKPSYGITEFREETSQIESSGTHWEGINGEWRDTLEGRPLNKSYTDQINNVLSNQIKKGQSKYGVTLEDGTLDVMSTLDHALEEIADLAFYLIHVRETLIGEK